jgi:hypothetical protein
MASNGNEPKLMTKDEIFQWCDEERDGTTNEFLNAPSTGGKTELDPEHTLEVWEGSDIDAYWLPQEQLELITSYYFFQPPEAPKVVTLKEQEDKVVATLDGLDELEKWILFKQMYNLGYRISNFDSEYRKLNKKPKE